MHSDQSIYDQLNRTLIEIEKQIREVKNLADENSMPVEGHELTSSDGQFLMTPLLLAKAQTLNGMAVLKAAGKKK